MKANRILILLVFAVMPIFSQPPSPTPRESSERQQNQISRKKGVNNSNAGNPEPLVPAIDKLSSEVEAWRQQESEYRCQDEAARNGWASKIQNLSPMGTLIAALATLVIAGINLGQWCSMRQQIDIANKTLLAAHGAHVTVESISVNSSFDSHGRPENRVDICVKNYGGGRAPSIHADLNIRKLIDVPVPLNVQMGELASGATSQFTSEPLEHLGGVDITDPAYYKFASLIGAEVFGKITYFDVFGNGFVMSFSAVYDDGPKMFNIVANTEPLPKDQKQRKSQ